ncbi:hypothetical protein SHKM778_68810 [Streptomyces sp. KM77-8]|uniref:Uncharacterized protein n=1 Tax=Streptomyces haneummycinicus TaxID=3074435 RepID=A0AAT9HSE5_9ACTN
MLMPAARRGVRSGGGEERGGAPSLTAVGGRAFLRAEAEHLWVVVADLVVELGVDVHAVVAEAVAPLDRRADQDLVQGLAVALVDVGVTLRAGEDLIADQRVPPPSRSSVVPENSKSLMSPSATTAAFFCVSRIFAVKSWTAFAWR